MTRTASARARKRDYDQLDAQKVRSCREHKGRKGKVTGLCAGCVQSHLEAGNFKWIDERTALTYSRYAPVWPQEAPGDEDSPYPRSDQGVGNSDAQNGLGLIVLVCGSREWTDRLAIWDELFRLRDKVELVIHGGARGADALAEECAKELGLPTRVYEADWDRHGKAAGQIRNSRMLKDGQPDLVLAFTENLEESRGTAGMVKIAEKAGVETRILS